MECFNKQEIKQLEKVLDHCGGYGNCDKCEFNWMEDHGIACYRVVAKNSAEYIKALKQVINTYDNKIEHLREVLTNG